MSLRDEILAQYDIRNLDIVFYSDYTSESKWQTWYDIIRYNEKYYKIKQYTILNNPDAPVPPAKVIEMDLLNLFEESHEIL